ncbi:MAG: hypothetical protein WA063_00885, partial [Minisyncoccia bacterium]
RLKKRFNGLFKENFKGLFQQELFKKINGDSPRYYLLLGIAWMLIAIVSDYVFLVLVFKPADGYYKLDVYLYYAFTFILPLLAGSGKKRSTDKPV